MLESSGGDTSSALSEILDIMRITEGQRNLVLAKNHFVVIEISPERVAQFV
jgi:hypothetical protein